MRKLTLEPVDNGLIKIITDNNSDGAGKNMEKKEIYILDDTVANTEKFIMGLIEDLGLFIGNEYDKDTLLIKKSFGPKYKLNHIELMEERRKLTHRLNELKKMNLRKPIERNEKEKISD